MKAVDFCHDHLGASDPTRFSNRGDRSNVRAEPSDRTASQLVLAKSPADQSGR